MPAPSPVEIANMQNWSLFNHYLKNRQMYVDKGRDLYRAVQAYIQKTQNNAATANQNLIITQDEIAVMVKSWLMNNTHWIPYLKRKPHLPPLLHITLTDIMSRYIAWDGYLDITK
jgi:hypothetical protein